jgi:DNA-binding transcriptional regulator YiaG
LIVKKALQKLTPYRKKNYQNNHNLCYFSIEVWYLARLIQYCVYFAHIVCKNRTLLNNPSASLFVRHILQGKQMSTFSRPDDVVSSRSSRANRLKRLRKMTRKSRKAFSELYGISQGTLQNWETARFGGLTEKGAHIILKALKNEGIHCNFEWLMYGAGTGPNIGALLVPNDAPSKRTKTTSIDDDLNVFKQLNENTIHMYVNDDTMTPYYSKGELVAGIIHKAEAIAQCIGHICIVKPIEWPQQIKLVRKSSKENAYHLIALNPLTLDRHANLHDVELEFCAPITWVRKEDS